MRDLARLIVWAVVDLFRYCEPDSLRTHGLPPDHAVDGRTVRLSFNENNLCWETARRRGDRELTEANIVEQHVRKAIGRIYGFRESGLIGTSCRHCL
jgi:hypothetical protein